MKIATVKLSTLNALGTWSPRTVIPIVEEAASRGVDIDTDTPGLLQCRDDINLMQSIEQKQRILPLPGRS